MNPGPGTYFAGVAPRLARNSFQDIVHIAAQACERGLCRWRKRGGSCPSGSCITSLGSGQRETGEGAARA
jgi:hypothetical protein